MCTVVVLVRSGHPYPVLLGANRDERLNRPWDPPAEHWPGIVGGRDHTGGGTWMAINRHGVVAAILNRAGTLGPAVGKRSRGELPLLALAQPTARQAAAAIAALEGDQWRPFNMVLADAHGALFVRSLGRGHPDQAPLPAGVSMITAYDPNDLESPRVARHLPRFMTVQPAGPDDWQGWQAILSDGSGSVGEQINVAPRGGFGTVCSSLVAIPANGAPIWMFAAGPPHEAKFRRLPRP